MSVPSTLAWEEHEVAIGDHVDRLCVGHVGHDMHVLRETIGLFLCPKLRKALGRGKTLDPCPYQIPMRYIHTSYTPKLQIVTEYCTCIVFIMCTHCVFYFFLFMGSFSLSTFHFPLQGCIAYAFITCKLWLVYKGGESKGL